MQVLLLSAAKPRIKSIYEKIKRSVAMNTTKETNHQCPHYKPEKENPYPLCDNTDCKHKTVCNISAHMNETPFWGDE